MISLILFFVRKTCLYGMEVMFLLLFFKVSRPSYIPFCGITTIDKHVPLSLVIDIIIEQGTTDLVCFILSAFCALRYKASSLFLLLYILLGFSDPGIFKFLLCLFPHILISPIHHCQIIRGLVSCMLLAVCVQ